MVSDPDTGRKTSYGISPDRAVALAQQERDVKHKDNENDAVIAALTRLSEGRSAKSMLTLAEDAYTLANAPAEIWDILYRRTGVDLDESEDPVNDFLSYGKKQAQLNGRGNTAAGPPSLQVFYTKNGNRQASQIKDILKDSDGNDIAVLLNGLTVPFESLILKDASSSSEDNNGSGRRLISATSKGGGGTSRGGGVGRRLDDNGLTYGSASIRQDDMDGSSRRYVYGSYEGDRGITRGGGAGRMPDDSGLANGSESIRQGDSNGIGREFVVGQNNLTKTGYGSRNSGAEGEDNKANGGGAGRYGYGTDRSKSNPVEELALSFANGFADFFKGQWQTIKDVATDPIGAYIDYMKDPWNYFLPAKLMRDQITEAAGIWKDVFKGNINGLTYRFGQKAALGVEMLAVNAAGKVVDKYIVKPDGSLSKPNSMETPQKALDTSGGEVNIIGEPGRGLINEGAGDNVSGKIYTPVEYNGTVKVNGEVKDVSRRVYQRNDIDINYFDETTGLTNLERMQARKPPIGTDGNPLELHHVLQQEAGPMAELREITHQQYYSQLHGLVENGASFRNNPLLNKQYNNFRYNYWKWRASLITGGK